MRHVPGTSGHTSSQALLNGSAGVVKAFTMTPKDSRLTGYRQVLARELEDRCQRNPRYSLRAYARDLGLQPGKLSEILRARCGLSGSLAGILADRLKLSAHEKRHFVAMVESEHARSPLRRQQAREELKTLEAQHGFSRLEMESFRVISDWQHFAIHELFLTNDFPGTIAAVAQKLKLTEEQATDAMERLAMIGLLKKDSAGLWSREEVSLDISKGPPSREIRRHHRQLLEKAMESLEIATVEERDFSSLTLAVPENVLPKVRDMIKEFTRRLNREVEEAGQKDRVYCLSVNFFPLDQKDKK